MKNKKTISTAIIALFALSITLAIHARHIGSRVVTACFEQVQLINQFGATITLPLSSDLCTSTKAEIINGGAASAHLWLNAVPSIVRSGCLPNGPIYCCVEFAIDSAAPPIVPNIVPQTGYALGKYKILQDALLTPRIHCHH